MRLCEVKGCTGTAVALVRVQLPGWRVAESRRVCSGHRFDIQGEDTMGKTDTTPTPTPATCSGCGGVRKLRARGLCSSCYTADLAERKRGAVEERVAALEAELDEVEALALAVLLELDEWITEDMADNYNAVAALGEIRKWGVNLKRYHEEARVKAAEAVDDMEAEGMRRIVNANDETEAVRREVEDLEEELDLLRSDAGVARDFLGLANDEVSGWTSRSGRLVAHLLQGAIEALDGSEGRP